MSHVIHVWESPVPDGLESASRLLQTHGGRPAAQNPKYRQLAATVRDRLAAHLASDPDAETPWAYDDPDGRCNSAFWDVQVKPAGAALASKLLAEAARPLGLVVFDEQLARLWLPDGRVFGLDGDETRPATAPPASLRSKSQVFGLLHDNLKALLIPLGWKGDRKQASFAFDAGEVRFEIGFGCVDRAPVFDLAMAATVVPRLPQPWQSLATRWADRCQVLIDDLLAAVGIEWPGTAVQAHVRYVRVDDMAGLQQLADAQLEVVRRVLLPLFQSCSTLEHLERRVNPPAGQPRVFLSTYLGPILAEAVHSPRAGTVMSESIAARREPWIQDKFRQLAADLDQARGSR